MTQEQRLHDELDRVGSRHQRLLLWIGLATCWLALAGIALGLLLWGRTAGRTIPGFVLVLLVLAPVVAVPILWALTRTWARPVAMARRIERRFPELDARLITALEQRADGTSGQLGFLQQAVIEEALDHARRVGWEQVIPPRVARAVKGMHHALAVVFAVALLALVVDISRRSSHSNWWTGGVASRETVMPEIQVEPGDTSIERGSSLLVLARFEKRLPNEVQLLERDADGQVRQMPMSRSLDDPLFAGRVGNVSRDLTYAVRYGDAQTKWYKATVFDYPELRQADVQLKYPTYTKLPEKLVEDTRSVSAVEGTRATFKFRLNKAVAEAQLVPSAATTQPAASAAKLSVDPKDPTQYSIAMDLARSQSFRLVLKDSDGRNNKEPPELVINVTQNRPPELKLEFPGHDVDVSPLEELSLKAKTSDDFGVARVGVTYAIAGQPPQDVVLDRNVPANRERDVADLIALEKLAAKPDQLLSYHFWAEDFGPDGKIRRTSSDMFFAEVRPFDQIFRQGQQPTADQQQQQQQQRSRNAQQAEELAELQKQIVAATWKVMRREITTPPSAQLVPDAKLIAESQSSAKEKAAALGERLQDERSSAFLKAALGHMDEATGALNKSGETNTVEPLASALSSEQAAYQDLLKLRAREHDVVRGGQQQQQQGGNSSAQARRQRQLDQLDLAKQDNRYASERSAPQQQDAQQRETRQVLSRLRELAQRQEDLNRQMRELEAQLAAAKQEAQREELKRQLARLRDQQQQMLRDTDELRDRMDQPENQQRLADSRQQLEQTRSNVRRASEALQKGMVPEAASAGARAAEQLNNLREQVRSSASGQFSEAMDRMRQNARELDQNQQDLSQRLATLDGAQPKPAAQGDAGAEQNGAPKPQRQRTLRDAGERRQVAQDLEQQKQKLQQLMDSVRKTVEDAETAEPLLSRQLYDAARQANQNKTDEALDASKRLLDRGFVDEAQKAENDAGRGIAGLRQGIEKAAQSVLGDEAEALRRARGELDALAQELDREMQRAGAAGVNSASTRPGAARQQVALGGPSTRRSMTSQPGQGGQARSPSSEDRQARAGSSSQPSEQQQGGQESRDQSASQPGSDRPRQSQQQARNSGGRATTQDSSQGGQPGSQDAQNRSERASNPQNARDAQRQGDSRNNSQQARGGQSGQQPGSARDGQSGQQSQTSSARTGGLRQRDANRAGGDRGGSNEDLRRLLDQANNDSQSGGGAVNSDSRTGPLTGGNFRDWSDRLRDVEEMVGDPRLRAQAAQVRDRARAMRAEFDRHSKEPNWDLVREFVGRPLVELRDKVAEELLRRGNAEALVPIDREPVPAEYSEQVQKYYEKLGSGR